MFISIFFFKIASIIKPSFKEMPYAWLRNRLIVLVNKRKQDDLAVIFV